MSEIKNATGLFHKVHRFLSEMDARYWSGFLGQLPTDARSKTYTKYLKLAGAQIGENSYIHHRVKIWRPENIVIGKGVRIPASTDMAGMGRITIGDYTLVGANVSFITNNHPLEDESLSWQEVMIGSQQDIIIGKYCWLMNNSTIIAGKNGLVVNDYSWIASGALVVKDIPEAQLWGGVPAAYIRNVHKRETAI